MIILNLLPTSGKKKIVNHYLLLLIKDVVFLFLLTSAILAILFLICYFILIKNFITTTEQNLSVMKNTGLITSKIRKVNRKLNSIEKIQNDYTNWVQFIVELNSLIPQNEIQITKLNIDKHQKIITINGKALERDGFLIFKKNLENSKIFTEINSPLSNLLLEKNINFSLEIKYEI